MDSQVSFTSTISPICLPPEGSIDQYVNKESVIIGWGTLKEGKMVLAEFYCK